MGDGKPRRTDHEGGLRADGRRVGDGTTTATPLTHALLMEGIRNIAAGASAVDLKRALDRGLGVIVNTLRLLSRPVQSRREKAQVATISVHNNSSIGELVAEAMEKVGPDGVITVEEAKGTETVQKRISRAPTRRRCGK